MDGVVVIDKPEGITSHDVVARVKKILGALKVGHLGTLDPMATGVLPLVINRATKYADALKGNYKEYLAVMKLGVETDTLDGCGRVISTSDVSGITEGDISRAFDGFCGNILQIPPMYSAVKINGTALYKLARKGMVVERTEKEVTIYSLDVCKINMPFVSFKVACSGGTYIRTICQDAGSILGCGACLVELRRTRSGRFLIEGAVSMDMDAQALKRNLIPLEDLLEPSTDREAIA